MSKEFGKTSGESRGCLRRAVAEMAKEAGMISWAAQASHSPSDGRQHVGLTEQCDAWCPSLAITVKTPKYSGQSDLEAFHAQIELLARAEETKALQLALCLNGDALSCLLLLPRNERQVYGALAEALQRQFR